MKKSMGSKGGTTKMSGFTPKMWGQAPKAAEGQAMKVGMGVKGGKMMKGKGKCSSCS